MKRIACIGDNCVDCYDETGERYPGGNPVNVSVYFQRLGIPSSYIGAVGNDENGRMIIDSLKKKNVDVSHVKELEGNTAITHVKRVNGERVFGDDDPVEMYGDTSDFCMFTSGAFMKLVKGIDYINPAMKPVFEEIANEAWKEVNK